MFKSIHAKLTLFHAVTFGMLLLSFVLILYFSIGTVVENTFDRILYNGAKNLEFIISRPPPGGRMLKWVKRHLRDVLTEEEIQKAEKVIEMAFKKRDVGEILDDVMDRVFFIEPVYAQVRKIENKHKSAADTKVIARSASLQEKNIPLSENTYTGLREGKPVYEMLRWKPGGGIRLVSIFVYDKEGNPYSLQVATSSEEMRNMMRRLRVFILLVVPILLALVALGGYFFVKRAFRPVAKIVRTVNNITSEDLSLRVESPGSKDEIGRLTDTFNRMIDRLEKSFHSIKEFSGNASHELKTPLTVIRGEIEVALRKDRNSEEYKNILSTIQDETANLQAIINDLLFMSKMDSGSVSFSFGELSLEEPLLDAYEENCDFAEGKGIKIILKQIDSIPFNGNRTLLRRLFANLIQNAVKYTEKDGTITITLTDKDGIQFAISDTGIGIPQQSLPYIFDSFYREEHSRSGAPGDMSGAGLGLPIVKRIVELHSGEIGVESRVGEGTVFTVCFPAH
ncbi:MAG: HAMP domain-containing protein [bacterium]|nr:HAMP domain-containing protein [bacterium]